MRCMRNGKERIRLSFVFSSKLFESRLYSFYEFFTL